MTDGSKVRQYQSNWQGEIDGAALYRALADAERQPQLSTVYRKLAETEETHALFWEEKLKAAGRTLPARRPGWRTRLLAALARRFGPRFVLPAITSNERVDSGRYASQPEASGTSMPADERSHARLLSAVTAGTSSGMTGGTLAEIEGRHRTAGGNALRAAVLGANDGLVSNLSLVMGVAGAQLSEHGILVTGVAGLLAGAGSMALGEWLSVQSSRELYERQIGIEEAELREVPEEEQEELALIYQAKGIPETQARDLAAQLMRNQATSLDTLVKEELGIDPAELGGSAWEAAVSSFILFGAGAILPVLPFLVLTGMSAVAASLALSAVGLFAIGAGITLMTGRSVLFSGTRQVVFGLAAAILTFGIGRLIGINLGG